MVVTLGVLRCAQNNGKDREWCGCPLMRRDHMNGLAGPPSSLLPRLCGVVGAVSGGHVVGGSGDHARGVGG
jgi:hypothetical protein